MLVSGRVNCLGKKHAAIQRVKICGESPLDRFTCCAQPCIIANASPASQNIVGSFLSNIDQLHANPWWLDFFSALSNDYSDCNNVLEQWSRNSEVAFDYKTRWVVGHLSLKMHKRFCVDHLPQDPVEQFFEKSLKPPNQETWQNFAQIHRLGGGAIWCDISGIAWCGARTNRKAVLAQSETEQLLKFLAPENYLNTGSWHMARTTPWLEIDFFKKWRNNGAKAGKKLIIQTIQILTNAKSFLMNAMNALSTFSFKQAIQVHSVEWHGTRHETGPAPHVLNPLYCLARLCFVVWTPTTKTHESK